MSEEAFQDIADAVHRLRVAFIKNGMKPPTDIQLGAFEDGDRLRYLLPREYVVPMLTATKRGPEWICSIMGIDFHMPARVERLPRHLGGGDYLYR